MLGYEIDFALLQRSTIEESLFTQKKLIINNFIRVLKIVPIIVNNKKREKISN